jgi:hypothetical protein
MNHQQIKERMEFLEPWMQAIAQKTGASIYMSGVSANGTVLISIHKNDSGTAQLAFQIAPVEDIHLLVLELYNSIRSRILEFDNRYSPFPLGARHTTFGLPTSPIDHLQWDDN